MKRLVPTVLAAAGLCGQASSCAAPSIKSIAFLEGCWADIDPQNGTASEELNLTRTPDGTAFRGRVETAWADPEGLTLSFSEDGATLVVENPSSPTGTIRTAYSRAIETPSGVVDGYIEAGVPTTAYAAEDGSGWIVVAHAAGAQGYEADLIGISRVNSDGASEEGMLFWGGRRACPDV